MHNAPACQARLCAAMMWRCGRVDQQLSGRRQVAVVDVSNSTSNEQSTRRFDRTRLRAVLSWQTLDVAKFCPGGGHVGDLLPLHVFLVV